MGTTQGSGWGTWRHMGSWHPDVSHLMLLRGEALLHPPAELLECHPHEEGTLVHRAHDGIDDVPQVALEQLQAALPHLSL